MDVIQNLLQSYLDLSPETQTRLLNTAVILFVLWLLRFFALRALNKVEKSDIRLFYTWRKTIDYTTAVLGIFLIGRLWLSGFQALATYLGLLSAGLAYVLQDLIRNLAGWVFIMLRRPFAVGDRIQIGQHAGDVIDIRLFELTMLEVGERIDSEQSTGRIIHIPNGIIFKEPLINYSQGLPYIWNEIPVLVTFESDWEKAKRILENVIQRYAPTITEETRRYFRQASTRFIITYTHLEPTVYTEVASSGVLLTMRYMVDPRKRRDSEHVIWEAVLKAFAPHEDVDFAYETTREYVHWREKKRPSAAAAQDATTIITKRQQSDKDS
jgi:small-conductance mechanosensitive channel